MAGREGGLVGWLAERTAVQHEDTPADRRRTRTDGPSRRTGLAGCGVVGPACGVADRRAASPATAIVRGGLLALRHGKRRREGELNSKWCEATRTTSPARAGSPPAGVSYPSVEEILRRSRPRDGPCRVPVVPWESNPSPHAAHGGILHVSAAPVRGGRGAGGGAGRPGRRCVLDGSAHDGRYRQLIVSYRTFWCRIVLGTRRCP